MKVKKYIIAIYESPLDYTHEFKRPIVEYYCSERNLHFNFHGLINVFRGSANNSRMNNVTNMERVEIPDQFLERLEEYLLLKESLIETARKLKL
jgi:hypothetical protein